MGGQAVNFWASYYEHRVRELAIEAPFTSKDIDFCGDERTVRTCAERLGGKARVATFDDATPNSGTVVFLAASPCCSPDMLGSRGAPPSLRANGFSPAAGESREDVRPPSGCASAELAVPGKRERIPLAPAGAITAGQGGSELTGFGLL